MRFQITRKINWFATLVPLFGLVVLSSLAIAQSEEDDDEEVSRFEPGIVVEQDSASTLSDRIFVDDATSDTEMSWRGFLQSDGNGEYRIAASFHGKLSVRINDVLVLDAESSNSPFAVSEPFELDFDQHKLAVKLAPLGKQLRLNLFWSGPGFRLEPIPANFFLHHRDERVSAPSDRGAELIRALRCEACHTLGGGSEGQRDVLRAPSLTTAANHVRRDWLVDFFRRPRRDDATEVNEGRLDAIHQQFDATQAEHIVAWLNKQAVASKQTDVSNSLENESDETNQAGSVESGHTTLHSVGCLACHVYEGVGETKNLLGGGDLTNVQQKRPSDFFAAWLRDPASVNKNHRMPTFDLSAKEVADLSALFNSTLGEDRAVDAGARSGERVDARGDAIVGERLATEHRCLSCHQDESSKRNRTELSESSNWTKSCLDESGEGRPAYESLGWLSEADVAAVKKASTDSVSDSALLLSENNCLQCHARGASLGLTPITQAVIAKHAHLTNMLGGMKPPALNSVGDKLLDPVLRDSITRKAKSIRPWLHVRMPQFPLTQKEVASIAAHFVSRDRVPDELQKLVDDGENTAGSQADTNSTHEIAMGERLVTSDGFGCTSCHAIGKVSPPKSTPANQLGPSLSMPRDRLRKPWFDRWVRNPARITPKMEMPSVQISVPGVLDENLDRQLDAVWNVLNVRRFSPPDAAPTRVVSRSGEGDQPAVVLTDVMKLQGEKLIKPFLIGLPNRQNLLFNFEQGNLAAIWPGDTAKQRTQGKTWFWEPATIRTRQGSNGPEFAIIRDDVQVPSIKRGQFMTEPDEWIRIENGIAFEHRIHFPDANSTDPRTIRVKQRVVSHENENENGFIRTIAFEGLEPGETIGVRSQLGAKSDRSVQDGFFVCAANERGRAEFRLAYKSDEPRAYRPQKTSRIASKLTELKVMPGFRVQQLPLRSDVMPISMAWKPNGTLVVGSLKGRVWLAHDSDGDEIEDKIKPISDDLAAPYGLHATQHHIDALSKYGLVRLYLNEKDEVVRHEMVASGWGHTDDYHDWVVGLPIDKQGNYYVSIPCQQDDRSVAAAHLRGTVLRLAPRAGDAANPRRFELQKISEGHRFPMGIALNRREQVFVTDNQGNYNPYNELNHVVSGAHFGFINKLQRKDDSRPPLTEPAIDIPHPWTRSVNGICFLDSPPDSESKFGPFEGHLVGCEYDTRRLIRMTLEEVGGRLQGAAYPLADAGPDANDSLQGPVNCSVAPDGDLYVANIRDSGWGGANNTGSLVRITPQLDRLPAGIREVSARKDGFVIRFTKPVDIALAKNVENYSVSSVRRISTPVYGGDDVDRRRESVSRAECSKDGLSVKLAFKELRAGFVYEFRLRDLLGTGEAFYPAEAYYTLRQIPVGK